jgi:hypothetical protein
MEIKFFVLSVILIFGLVVNATAFQLMSCEVEAPNKFSRLDSTLVGYWPCEEGQGDSLHDYSFNKNHGSSKGHRLIWEQGKVGKYSIYLDGGCYVTMGDIAATDFGPGEDFTITGWFKTNGNFPMGGGYVLSDYENVNPNEGGYHFQIIGSNGNIYFALRDGGISELTINRDFTDNEWHFFAIQRMAKQLNFFYSYDDMLFMDYMACIGGSAVNGKEFVIGTYSWLLGSYLFVGNIDDIRVFNRALTVDEINQLFNIQLQMEIIYSRDWVRQGETMWTKIKLINSGAGDIEVDKIRLDIEGPLTTSIDVYKNLISLAPGEERSLWIKLIVPNNALLGSYSCTLNAEFQNEDLASDNWVCEVVN